ncbi:MAG TPA: hypothetical protein VNK44_01645 [Candidatus Nitrosotenuis sp.]|nr:hypothetical protein [Candidatus Nitrosotenuis sp.]
MAKHIQRIPKDEPKKESRDLGLEEWKFVPGIEPRPETPDPLIAKDRTITFTNKINKATKEEILREKSEELKDQATNTDQYFRFANELIKEKLNKINNLRQSEKKFTAELSNFCDKAKSREELDVLDPKYITEEDANVLIMRLEEEFERMKDKLLYQELIVQKTKDEIATRRKQIQQVKEKLKSIQKTPTANEITNPIQVLRDELKKAGIDEKNSIFQILNHIEETIDMRKLRDEIRKDS